MANERRPTLRNRIGYLVLLASERVFMAMRWHVGRAVARRISDLVYLLDRPQRKAEMARNIKDTFPHLTGRQVRDIVRGAYCFLAESTVDARHFHELVIKGRCTDVLEVEGGDELRNPARKVGIIFVTGHFGCWEVLGLAGASLGYPLTSVARTMRNPLIDRHMRRLREAAGEIVVPKRGAMLQALRVLKAGGNLAFLVDQDARRDGIFVDFLGKPASTTSSPARLAYATGAPIAFVYARRLGQQNRFRIVVADVIWPRRDAGEAQEVLRMTQRMSHDLEEVVRKWPTGWMWMHRRWKTYPGKYRRRRQAGTPGESLP